MPAFENKGGTPTYMENGTVDLTMKMCAPFSDTFNFGYIQKTWCEIRIERTSEWTFKYFYSGPPQPLGIREKTFFNKDFFQYGHYEEELIWKTYWSPKLPKGYSALITHPLNRADLPFTTLSGVVDADVYHHDSGGNHSFLLNKGFEGVIPVGTPMYQIIPFKRDNWVSEVEEYSESTKYDTARLHNVFWGAYRNQFWQKKSYK